MRRNELHAGRRHAPKHKARLGGCALEPCRQVLTAPGSTNQPERDQKVR